MQGLSLDIGSTDAEADSVQRGSRYPYGSRYLCKGGLGNRASTVSSTDTEADSVTDTEAVSVSVQEGVCGICIV